jgi:hypothetical protein
MGRVPADGGSGSRRLGGGHAGRRVRVPVVRSRLLGKCLALSSANGSRLNAAEQGGWSRVLGVTGRHGAVCSAKTPAHDLACWFTLGGRAHPTRIPVHGPYAGLAGPPGGQRRCQGRGDLGSSPRGRGAAAAGPASETGLG